ncbi:MAG TPA: cytochrome c oxidase subunit II [Methylomirabilota bacterium]|nr:cytochrome c oxidase subunit II [Methylomirabilota bacterium]
MQKLLGLPELASVHGHEVDKLIIYVHYLMGALFVGWTIYFLYTIWRFRRSRNPKADYVGVTNNSSNYIEGAVVVVEAVLLLVFAVPLWARAVDDFPPADKSVVVRVTGRQFNWIARYPGADGIFGKQDARLATTENPMGIIARDAKRAAEDPAGKDDIVVEGTSEVVIPVHTNVIVHVSSLDVIHSFKVPALRVTQDAIPGMSIPIYFEATRTNTYQINCAQLCGNGHSTMKGLLRIVPPADFDAWVKSKAGAAPVSYE